MISVKNKGTSLRNFAQTLDLENLAAAWRPVASEI